MQDKKPSAERHYINWKTGAKSLTAVEIDLASVVLNPKSHRIRSQIESHAERDTTARDPFGPRAQEVIAQVLRETERFDQLKSDLKDFGQRDHVHGPSGQRR